MRQSIEDWQFNWKPYCCCCHCYCCCAACNSNNGNTVNDRSGWCMVAAVVTFYRPHYIHNRVAVYCHRVILYLYEIVFDKLITFFFILFSFYKTSIRQRSHSLHTGRVADKMRMRFWFSHFKTHAQSTVEAVMPPVIQTAIHSIDIS